MSLFGNGLGTGYQDLFNETTANLDKTSINVLQLPNQANSILQCDADGNVTNLLIGSGVSYSGGQLSATGTTYTVTSADSNIETKVSGANTQLTLSRTPTLRYVDFAGVGSPDIRSLLATSNTGKLISIVTSNGVQYDFNDLSGIGTISLHGSPTLTGLTLSGLTASTLLLSNGSKQLTSLAAGSNLQYLRGDNTYQTLNTSVVPESGNLYFTDARARAALSAGTGISYNSGTGVISTSGLVTSITGTANQVIASAATGAVTLSLPQSIHTGATPTFSRLAVGDTYAVGDSAILTTKGSLSADQPNGILLNSTVSFLNEGSLKYGRGLHLNALIAGSGFQDAATQLYIKHRTNSTRTVTYAYDNSYGIEVDVPTAHAGGGLVPRRQYGIYSRTPTQGTTSNCAIYGDNLSVGYAGVSPPASGAIISGNVGIGKNSASTRLDVNGTVTATQVIVSGLTASRLVATDGSNQLTSTTSGISPQFTGLNLSGLTASSLVATDGSKNLTSTTSGISPTFTDMVLSGGSLALGTTNTTNTIMAVATTKVPSSSVSYGVLVNPGIGSSLSSADIYSLFVNANVNVPSVNTANSYVLRVGAMAHVGAGVSQNAYGLSVRKPATGTNRFATQTDDLYVGSTISGTNILANGIYTQAGVMFGSTSPTQTALNNYAVFDSNVTWNMGSNSVAANVKLTRVGNTVTVCFANFSCNMSSPGQPTANIPSGFEPISTALNEEQTAVIFADSGGSGVIASVVRITQTQFIIMSSWSNNFPIGARPIFPTTRRVSFSYIIY